MSELNTFITELKQKNKEFSDLWESNRPRREFINNVVQSRIEKKITQKELAKKAGLSQPAVARFESGDNNPSLRTVMRILSVLNMKLKVVPCDETICLTLSYRIEGDNNRQKPEWHIQNINGVSHEPCIV